MDCLDTTSPFLSLPDGLVIASLLATETQLVVHVACRLPTACCPLCQLPSDRIHDHYGRTVTDLPCAGRRVILALTVRKFVCRTPTCPRQIFTERMPDLVQSYARITNRLRDVLIALGLATSAEVCARLAPKLGMQVSPSTLLRLLHTVSCASPTSVRILGIDDWSWKKGQIYGTLLVDLERRRPIEILPDRKEETVGAWLLTHPEIEVVSRDRGGEYAAAARKGAPQAKPIADKFHLLLNLREKLKELMARKQKLLPHVETTTSGTLPASRAAEVSKSFRHMPPHLRVASSGSAPIPPEETPSQISRSNRYARYEAVRTLHQQAISQREIARRLKLSRQTVHRFLTAETFPERSRLPYRGSVLDPYKPYILERWQSGCWNGTQLYHEVKMRGYTGSDSLFRLFISQLRKQHQRAGTASVLILDTSGTQVKVPADSPPKPSPKRRISPTRASWLCVCQPDKLDEKQRQHVEQIRAAHRDLDTAYQLSQAFVAMLAKHRAQDLDDWLLQAKQRCIRELKSFAKGIRRDYTAVRAAFTSAWRNGQVEAQVNCLKLQKRLMFGRAKFDVLRLHVLRRI
ncbi:MAG: ISL3 family transposase [Ktedonobacteraceae bacterium]